MSSAKKDRSKISLCSHIRNFASVLFHRAKPVSELERSGSERHCGVPPPPKAMEAQSPVSELERSGSERHCGVPPSPKLSAGGEASGEPATTAPPLIAQPTIPHTYIFTIGRNKS